MNEQTTTHLHTLFIFPSRFVPFIHVHGGQGLCGMDSDIPWVTRRLRALISLSFSLAFHELFSY